jgi:uncharacterized membrane protein YccC
MITRLWGGTRDRIVASDPGYVRLRLGLSAVLSIVVSVAVLAPLGFPLPVILVAAIGAMMSAFTVNDPTPGQQAVTLVLALVVGAAALTLASIGSAIPPLDSVIFVLLIFVAVYAQRFGSRGIALGSVSFFLFFFAMFLQTHLRQVPELLLAFAVGIASNALVRFVLLRRRADAEFLRVRRASRARVGAVIRVAENYLASGGGGRQRKQLRRANDRLHESILLIEDAAKDLMEEPAASILRRRAIEVELAVQWLSLTVLRTSAEDVPPDIRDDLIASLQRFRSLIERDPRELPLISETGEFSKMLVQGSRIDDHPGPGDELRRAIAELALADVNAERVTERDFSAENIEPDAPEDQEKTAAFTYDNQTRSAIQAVVGGGLAVIAGELVSHQRWYWAVLTVFVVFLGSATAGATFVKGARRLVGTLIGILGGVLLALLVTGSTPATLALILVCVFGMVYLSRVSQVMMAFFITSMLALLYSLLGTFSIEVLWVRLAETAVGAAAGLLAAAVIVPVRTRAVMLDDVAEALEDLREFLDKATSLLSGSENVNIIELARDLDRAVAQVRTTVEPLTHPINVSSARRDYGWHVLTTLETIAFRARHVAARSQPGALDGEDRLALFTGRIIRNVDVLLEAVRSPGRTGHGQLVLDDGTPVSDEIEDRQVRSLLSSLGQLDNAVIALGRAFDVDIADQPQSIKPTVSGRTRSAHAEADSIARTNSQSVSWRTQ